MPRKSGESPSPKAMATGDEKKGVGKVMTKFGRGISK